MNPALPGQSALFASLTAPQHDDARIIVGDADVVLPTLTGADFVHADPPWMYDQVSARGDGTAARVDDEYDTAHMDMIARHIDMLRACATSSARLVVWCTYPQLGAWLRHDGHRWRYVTGGSWHKRPDDAGRMGQGYHVRGDAEPWLLYTQGATGRPLEAISNSHTSSRTEHSEKPVALLRAMVRAYSPPGGLVLDLYAGRAPLGVACVLEGRRYVGVEIDPERAEIGRANIATAVARRARGEA